jgi:hypothetical protein
MSLPVGVINCYLYYLYKYYEKLPLVELSLQKNEPLISRVFHKVQELHFRSMCTMLDVIIRI